MEVSERGGDVPECFVSLAFLSILPAASEAAVQALRWRAQAPFLGDGETVSMS